MEKILDLRTSSDPYCSLEMCDNGGAGAHELYLGLIDESEHAPYPRTGHNDVSVALSKEEALCVYKFIGDWLNES